MYGIYSQLSVDFSLGIAFSVHGTMLFFSAFSPSCAPVSRWDAYRRGSSRCISWYHIWLILTSCYVRHHVALWDNRSIGQL